MAVKRVLGLLLALTLLLIPGGCWSREEIEQLSIVNGIGVDKVEVDGREMWRTTMRIITPGEMGANPGEPGGTPGETPDWLVSGIGETILEAGRNISTRSPRRAYLGHISTYVVGEKAAREGLQGLIDTTLRDPRVRMRPWIFIAKGSALDILRAEPEMEMLIANEIKGIAENSLPIVSKGYAVSFKDFAIYLASPGRDAVAARLELLTPQEEPGGGGEGASGPSQAVRINGLAVFRQDRLAGWMEARETMGYLYVIGEARGGIIPLRLPGHRDVDLAVAVSGSRSEITPQLQDGRVIVFIDIQAKGDLGEHLETIGVANPSTIDELEKELAGEIRRMAEESIRLAQQEYRADIFGFGEQLRRANPRAWKEIEQDWPDIYPTVEVVINVETIIRSTGMIVNTPDIR